MMNWYAITGGVMDGEVESFICQADCDAHAIEQFKDWVRSIDPFQPDDDEIEVCTIVSSYHELWFGEVPELLGHLPTPTHTATDAAAPTTESAHFMP